MTSHRRVKDIAYDEDDIYSDEDYDEAADSGYTEDDKRQFAALTPVVRAHLEEAGSHASNVDIEEALYHYYWDIAKSVDYLKKKNTPKQQPQTQKPKPKSKFDQAAEKSAATNGTSSLFITPGRHLPLKDIPMSQWLDGIDWKSPPQHLMTTFVPVQPPQPAIKLLGGSSKLAKLAEERRKKAEAVKIGLTDRTNDAGLNTTTSSLDRLTLNKPEKRSSDTPEPQTRKYPARKKREPTPPLAEPEPEVEPEEVLPDIRAQPSAFGRVLASKPAGASRSKTMTLQELFGSGGSQDAFKGPSPDDVVFKAHGQSKSLNK